MKLFIAINFKKKIQYKIQDIIRDVRSSSIKGRFVNNEHMHMTLEYFGEVLEDRVNDIVKVMYGVDIRGFTLKVSSLNYFRKSTGNIYWVGVKENYKLLELQDNIHNELLKKEFDLEGKTFVPHITIGRQVVMKDSFNPEEYIKQLNKIRN